MIVFSGKRPSTKILAALFTMIISLIQLTYFSQITRVEAASDFDKDHLKSIEILKLKKDYFPRQYFNPIGEGNTGSPTLELRLTDINDKQVQIKYNQQIDGQSAFVYYNLAFFLPEGMEERGMMLVGDGPDNKIALPDTITAYDGYQGKLKIGVQWLGDKSKSVKGESKPEVYVWFLPMHITNYAYHTGGIQVQRQDPNNGKWRDVNNVPVNTTIRLRSEISRRDYLYPTGMHPELKLQVPGFKEYVKLSRKSAEYVHLSEEIKPTIPTKDYLLKDLPGVKTTVRAFSETKKLNILPPVIFRGSDKDVKKAGWKGDYNRLILAADTPEAIKQGQSKGYFGSETQKTYYLVYDIQKDVTYAEAKKYIQENMKTATETSTVLSAIETLPTANEKFMIVSYNNLPIDDEKLTADKTVVASYISDVDTSPTVKDGYHKVTFTVDNSKAAMSQSPDDNIFTVEENGDFVIYVKPGLAFSALPKPEVNPKSGYAKEENLWTVEPSLADDGIIKQELTVTANLYQLPKTGDPLQVDPLPVGTIPPKTGDPLQVDPLPVGTIPPKTGDPLQVNPLPEGMPPLVDTLRPITETESTRPISPLLAKSTLISDLAVKDKVPDTSVSSLDTLFSLLTKTFLIMTQSLYK